MVATNVVGSEESRYESDSRILLRGKRRIFHHTRAFELIIAAYLGPGSIFNGKDFEMILRVLRERFVRMMFDFKRYNNSFCQHQQRTVGLQETLLYPLKQDSCFHWHAFLMECLPILLLSSVHGKRMHKRFNLVMKEVNTKEYLRLSNPADLKSTTKLHKAIHGVKRVFGSLKLHAHRWKKCYFAWQGFSQGEEKASTIALEAFSDCQIWFWHLSYGYTSTLYERIILDLS